MATTTTTTTSNTKTAPITTSTTFTSPKTKISNTPTTTTTTTAKIIKTTSFAATSTTQTTAEPTTKTGVPTASRRPPPPFVNRSNTEKNSHWHDWSLYWVTSTEAQPRPLVTDRRKLPRLDDDGPYSSDAANNRWRSLSCPTFCPQESNPVCGSDKMIYKNDCEMRMKNCNKEVETVDLEECTLPSGATCDHECDKEKDLVCGTDGRTYLNKCFLQVEFCQRGIEFAHYGSCLNGSSVNETCPSLCTRQDRDGPICGSDGNVYSSTCEMKRATCGQGVVSVDRRHCQTTEHCESECHKISRLSCGSDGKLYNNGCQMQRKNCGRHIFEVPVPYCLNRLYRTDCPKDCSDEDTNHVCGSDGNIYRNECEMKKITCGFPLTRYDLITVVDFSKCADKSETCSKMVCPYEKEEVCGTDGVTYANKCHLSRVTCTTGVQISHNGRCVKEMKVKETCPDKCDPISDKNSTLCGSDGNTYPSECEMKRRTCGQFVVTAPLSHCQTTKFCDAKIVCPVTSSKRAVVCGSDGQFYTSQCEMRKTNCGKHIFEVPISQCLSNFKFVFTGCGRMCPKEYDPICGTDDKTYSNQCFMEMENCRARSLGGAVRRKYLGKCGEPKQSPRNYISKR